MCSNICSRMCTLGVFCTAKAKIENNFIRYRMILELTSLIFNLIPCHLVLVAYKLSQRSWFTRSTLHCIGITTLITIYLFIVTVRRLSI